MNIKIDTHTHTIASGHAYSTIHEMVAMAKHKKLDVLAITEHAPAMPGSCHEYYFANARVLPRDYNQVYVLFGAELNIMDRSGRLDLHPTTVGEMDINIASLHMHIFEDGGTRQICTDAYVNAMKNPNIHIIGHPDDSRCLPDFETVVRVAKETDTLLEINNSSLMPSSFRIRSRENIITILELCKKYKAKVTTGSDAHVDWDVGNFGKVKKIFKVCNFPEELVVTTDISKLIPYVNPEAGRQLKDKFVNLK
jgi:putative hydrolase